MSELQVLERAEDVPPALTAEQRRIVEKIARLLPKLNNGAKLIIERQGLVTLFYIAQPAGRAEN